MADEFDLSGFGQALGVTSSKQSKLEGLHPELAQKVQEAQAAYKKEFGKEFPIVSGFRSTQEQADFKRNNPNNPYPVAAPGTSLHETGNAVDIPKDIPDKFLARFGLHRPLGEKDAVHVTLMPKEQTQPNESGFDLTGFGQALTEKMAPSQLKTQLEEKKKSVFDTEKQKHNAQIEEAFGKIPGYKSLEAFGAGMGGNVSKAMGGLQQLVGKGVAMVAPETGQAISQNALQNVRATEQQMAPYQKERPLTTMAGEVAGAVANPVNKLIPGGSATGLMGLAQGAGQGALSNVLTTPVTDENKAFLTAKLEQAFAGGVGGAAGTALGKLPGAIAEPFKKSLSETSEKSIKTLRDAGVPIDVAQATGSEFLKRTKAASFDNPHTAGKAEEFASIQKAAFNKAIAKTMGEDATAITPNVIQAAKTRLGQNYDDLAARNKIHFDDELKHSLAEINDRASNALADTQYSVIEKAIKSIETKAETSGGTIDGEQYKNIKRLLTDIEKQNVPGSHYAGEMKELLLETLSRSAEKTGSKADVALLKDTNRQYGNMKKIEDVVLKDIQGNVSPSLLSNSLTTKAKRNALYQTDPELANLARAGKDILEQKLPNSGTMARMLAQSPIYAGTKAIYQSGAQAAMANPKLAKYFEQGVGKGPVRSVLQTPQKLGQMLPEYMQKPGAVGGTTLRELINQRNLEAQQ